ncbi:MAG: alpha amylase C-terminal domain-containing protein [Akkermansia sp.]|nr:alpha amylase C-terminal domain-containing protein [Akkermansia sp.]
MRRAPIPGLVLADGWLAPYEREIKGRMRLYDGRVESLCRRYGSLMECANGFTRMGFNQDPTSGEWMYREWAPGARALYLIGDFNGWNRSSHPMQPGRDGVWELRLPAGSLPHGSRVKVHVVGADNVGRDRIPAWIRYTYQDPATFDYSGVIWAPEQPYKWRNTRWNPANVKVPFIYEAHIGMAGEEERVHSYREFADNVLPRVAELGYNVVQLMAIQEHPYYGSFGYHVSSFFAPCNRFGTPEDLKYLIDTAHGLGIAVLLDVVHSHAVKNVAEGLNNFDGSGGQYFNAGKRDAFHPDWDSCLFDYGRTEVIEFLLSNLRWWLQEFHFDGFRFDGVTSMLYLHHGHEPFTDLGCYFNTQVNIDAVVYLQLAAAIVQQVRPGAFAIAEDMSGMPGLCRPVDEGGFGFTHRLAMGLPDYWIKLLKEKKDEDWSVGDIWYTLINRRYGEANIAYAESHDQALVGDKTIAFRLMDAEMYTHMSCDLPSLDIDRGIALHKMIRLATLAAGGEGWLNFMGNEFGHPEWIDFPREGNGNSYKYCRRQWSLVDNKLLRYRHLNAFDRAMLELAKRTDLLSAAPARPLNMDEKNQVMAFERAGLIFVFNWNGTQAIPDYKLPAPAHGEWKVVLDSDSSTFGGLDRQDHTVNHFTDKIQQLSLYLLPRTVTVLARAYRGGANF